ncbi:MAG TPA: DNA recombination protein RmuC, partial [Acidimicrobiaceae bacterium]|nr:DNA recombination protein RmuC [Acidimicrobiaceae bacterium]
AARERDLAVQAALEHAVTLVQAQLGATTQAADASLASRQQLIDAKLGEVQAGVQADLARLHHLVQQLGQTTSEKLAVVDHSLQAHAEITQSLAGTASSLREALASSNARGQWGERMADDVLRLAGLHEHVNYVKRTAVAGEGTGIPDFTFLLPKGHVLFMDVKFPMAAYLKFLDAGTEAEKSAHRAAFVRDVRARVRELAKREYAATDARPTVSNVLLFVPNESLAAFIHEADPSLVEEALRQQVVICSPLTLYAFLGVIRQAFDNFMLEQTSQEILGLLGTFSQQWGKYTDSVEKVKRQFDTVARSFDELATTRRRALERPLLAIDDLRRKQALPVDGQLFGTDELEWDNVRELGA